MAFTNYDDMTPKRTSTILISAPNTDSSFTDSPDKKRYSSSTLSSHDEDREKRLAAVIDRFRSDVKNDNTVASG